MKNPKNLNLKSGFTIVELLIVIIVIAILATLVITAYNGVQTRAKNTKTVSAIEGWAKLLRLYQIDNDEFPQGDTCLGNADTYPSNECEPGSGVADMSIFDPYVNGGNLPEPDITKITNPSDSSDYRSGLSYYSPDGSIVYIWYVMLKTDQCPKIGELSNNHIQDPYNGGIQCVGELHE